jgi:hypothetical protein
MGTRVFNKSPEKMTDALVMAAKSYSTLISESNDADLRETPKGRKILVSFRGAGAGRTTNIYLDEIEKLVAIDHHRFRAPHYYPKSGIMETRRTNRSRVKRAASGKREKPDSIVHVARSYMKVHTDKADVFIAPEDRPIPSSLKRFAIHFVVNLRKIICPKKGASASLSTANQSLITGISTWIVSSFGTVPAVAKALAAAVLIVIVTATRGTFCDMTAEMARAALKEA